MNCDFLRIVTEGFTIPKTVFSKYIFVKICVWSSDKLNCSCLIISPSELILIYEMRIYMT